MTIQRQEKEEIHRLLDFLPKDEQEEIFSLIQMKVSRLWGQPQRLEKVEERFNIAGSTKNEAEKPSQVKIQENNDIIKGGRSFWLYRRGGIYHKKLLPPKKRAGGVWIGVYYN